MTRNRVGLHPPRVATPPQAVNMQQSVPVSATYVPTSHPSQPVYITTAPHIMNAPLSMSVPVITSPSHHVSPTAAATAAVAAVATVNSSSSSTSHPMSTRARTPDESIALTSTSTSTSTSLKRVSDGRRTNATWQPATVKRLLTLRIENAKMFQRTRKY